MGIILNSVFPVYLILIYYFRYTYHYQKINSYKNTDFEKTSSDLKNKIYLLQRSKFNLWFFRKI